MARTTGGTRSALLDAALDAFAGGGYAGASIRDITRVVGVRESAFYAHFPSKRAIYDELFADVGPPVAARAIDALSEDRPPHEFLPRFAASIVDSWSTPRARKFAAMMMRDAFDSEAQGVAHAARVDRRRDRLAQRALRALAACGPHPGRRPGRDARLRVHRRHRDDALHLLQHRGRAS
jgi:AcrR family transcriptional regulator